MMNVKGGFIFPKNCCGLDIIWNPMIWRKRNIPIDSDDWYGVCMDGRGVVWIIMNLEVI